MAEEKSTKTVGKYNVTTFPPLNNDGAFGTVYEAFNKTTKEKVAVKCIIYKEKDGKRNEERASMAFKEIKSTQAFKDHPHIVQFLDYVMDRHAYWLFMEFCELGDLGDYLAANPGLRFERKVVIMHQIADAIAFMHGHQTPLVHRDVKLKNILVKQEGSQVIVKVSDFGLSKLFEGKVNQIYSFICHHACSVCIYQKERERERERKIE